MNPDWTKRFGTVKAMEEFLGFKYQEAGWYITKTDTVYVEKLESSVYQYEVMVWNDPNARAEEIRKLQRMVTAPIVNLA